MRHRLHVTLSQLALAAPILLGGPGGPLPARAAPLAGQRTLSDYRYFRALSIDLVGRMPTREELAAFERPDFDLSAWLDQRLQGEDYAERMTRIYADLLRPQLAQSQFGANRNGLARILVKDDAGKDTWVYYRPGQRRVRSALVPKPTDPDYPRWNNLARGGFCLLEEETGLKYPDVSAALAPTGTAKPVAKAVLDQHTTVVKPWWLYADYRAASPAQRYDAATWPARFPGYALTNDLLKDPDGTTDTTTIRVCKEEAGTLLAAPSDLNPTLQLSCRSGAGVAQSSACGCGPGLELCMPTASFFAAQPRAAFISSRSVLLGVDDPTDQAAQEFRLWQSTWLGQEPLVYMNDLFAQDRDFREIVTGRHTFVNGPLAQFYRFSARANWNDADLGQTPLPAPESMPQGLLPFEAMRWERIADRGPNAAGILTMPLFLMKNATRRARAHAVYNTFLCRDFVAPAGLQLPISTEPNLMKRAGCAACHQTLEPLSAYFSRVVENDWSWLDAKLYPAQSAACKQVMGKIPAGCAGRYDNVFSTAEYGALRGAYAAPDHADAGPAGLGADLASRPDFARCAVQNVAQSFLGRDLHAEDAALVQGLVDALSGGGFRMRRVVKALLDSPAYRSANNLSSTEWRGGQP